MHCVTKASSRNLAIVAVICTWLKVLVYIVYAYLVSGKTPFSALSLMIAGNLSMIAYCHISVYAVSRRHRRQIISEQISQAAIAKFLEQKKAWKTTAIIIGVACLFFLPGVVKNVSRIFISGGIFNNRIHRLFFPVFFICMMLNSLFNPIVYCWKIRSFRKALFKLLI